LKNILKRQEPVENFLFLLQAEAAELLLNLNALSSPTQSKWSPMESGIAGSPQTPGTTRTHPRSIEVIDKNEGPGKKYKRVEFKRKTQLTAAPVKPDPSGQNETE